MGNRPEWIVASLAVTTLGAVVVSMNTWWTPREIEYALSHSDARLLVCTRRYLRHDDEKEIGSIRDRLPLLRQVVGVGDELPSDWLRFDALDGTAGPGELPLIPRPDDPAFLLYTSGSTQQSEGRAARCIGAWSRTPGTSASGSGCSEQDRLWLGGVAVLGLRLLQRPAGRAHAMADASCCRSPSMPADALRTDGGRALHRLLRDAEHGAGRASIIPNSRRATSSRLRTGTTFGNATTDAARPPARRHEICNVYGMTETYGNSHVAGAGDSPASRSCLAAANRCRALRNASSIPRPERTCPRGRSARSASRAMRVQLLQGRGPDRRRLRRARLSSRAGDLGCVDAEGRLQFHGRLKEMVKTGGINVSPAEIEAVLMMHPDVQLAVVVGVPASRPRRGSRRGHRSAGGMHAQRCANCSTTAGANSHRTRCLPSSGSRRKRDLPLTTTGKVQKNRIAEVFFADRGDRHEMVHHGADRALPALLSQARSLRPSFRVGRSR